MSAEPSYASSMIAPFRAQAAPRHYACQLSELVALAVERRDLLSKRPRWEARCSALSASKTDAPIGSGAHAALSYQRSLAQTGAWTAGRWTVIVSTKPAATLRSENECRKISSERAAERYGR